MEYLGPNMDLPSIGEVVEALRSHLVDWEIGFAEDLEIEVVGVD